MLTFAMRLLKREQKRQIYFLADNKARGLMPLVIEALTWKGYANNGNYEQVILRFFSLVLSTPF